MYFVLENNLFEEYIKFKNNIEFSIDKIKKILYYYKDGFIPNKAQINIAKNLINNFDESEFLISLSGFDLNMSIENLSKHTKTKLILSNDKGNFPYVNINNDVIENNLSATFAENINRDKAKQHIRALLENANYIVICDEYIVQNFQNFKNFIQECVPKKILTIEIIPSSKPEHLIRKEHLTEIKQIYNKYKVKKAQQINTKHDRYIKVDNQIEIILTSGIDYLMDISKDFTYIVRKL